VQVLWLLLLCLSALLLKQLVSAQLLLALLCLRQARLQSWSALL
jgi:hypothetical protein